jgi:hypothetical protein
MLFVILTSPGSPAYTLVYSVFWVVGLVPYTLIMYVGLNPRPRSQQPDLQ